MNRHYRGYFFFDPNEEIFEKHFPGIPVVPGSMILSYFLKEIQKILNCLLQDLTVKNFKFIKFISPGEYEFQINFKENYISCKLFDNDKIVSKGKVFYNYGK